MTTTAWYCSKRTADGAVLCGCSDEDGTLTVRSRGSAEGLDEAKAESYAVVEGLREQQAQAKKRLAKRTGKIASR